MSSNALFAVVERNEVAADRGADKLVPWWSFTKTILAAAALVLVDRRKLSLDAKVTGHDFSLRQLLQHRSGLTDYGGLRSYHEAVKRGDEPWSISSLLDRTEARRLRYPPGEGWAYSNIGYLFVRQIIERATGGPLQTALTRLVLTPLQIRLASVANTAEDLAETAWGNGSGYQPGWVYHGLVCGTPGAAASFLHRLLTGELLSTGLLGEMMKSHDLEGPIPGRPWEAPGYGLGLMMGLVTGGHKVIGHTGQGPGSAGAVYHFPDRTPPRTVATFSHLEDQAVPENEALRLAVG